MKIKVVDDICGSGKTSWAIQRINEAKFGEKFIYVTPYLDEVDRIINATTASFLEPEITRGRGSKYEHFKELLKSNSSIVTTHQLFRKLDAEALETIKSAGYTLIMDEVANVINHAPVGPKELQYLLDAKAIEVNEDGSVVWIDQDYGKDKDDKKFRDLKMLAESKNLFIINNAALYWTMNVKNFTAFKDVYILTYLFDGQLQRYYYDIYNVEYEKFSVSKLQSRYAIMPYNKFKEPRQKVYELLNIYQNYKNGKSVSKLNTNYIQKKMLHPKTALSSNWFSNAMDEEINQLKKNLRNFFEIQHKTENKKLFWTTKKAYADKLKNPKCTFNKKDDRTKDNFVSLTMRATNNYAECTAMAYAYNRYANPMETEFFKSKGAIVNEDVLAMSDLIQFLFRGCIRRGLPMNCYIPSERMRQLLKDWSEFRD